VNGVIAAIVFVLIMILTGFLIVLGLGFWVSLLAGVIAYICYLWIASIVDFVVGDLEEENDGGRRLLALVAGVVIGASLGNDE
jgi:O-antigen/teichoic acid export membrane protein